MTSSLRNSIHRRNHKERSQLAHRAKLGLLEKHSDYVKRARDYHSKQDRLTRLKQKATERNKDEFYFSMTRENTKGGVHVKDRGNEALPTDIVKVLKTQDENYVRTMRASNLKKIDNLKRQLMEMADLLRSTLGSDNGLEDDEFKVLVEAGVFQTFQGKNALLSKPKHIVFVDESEALQQKNTIERDTPADSGRSTPTDLGWKMDIKAAKASIVYDGDNIDTQDNQTSTLNRTRILKELSARLRRDTQLRYAQREFELQRLLMGKGSRKKIAAVEKVEQDDQDEEDQNEIDARNGRKQAPRKVDEALYKPRVYKWRLERSR